MKGKTGKSLAKSKIGVTNTSKGLKTSKKNHLKILKMPKRKLNKMPKDKTKSTGKSLSRSTKGRAKITSLPKKNIRRVVKTTSRIIKKSQIPPNATENSILIPACIIAKKANGNSLTREEIRYFVDKFTSKEIPDYQMAALLMAIYINGLTTDETAALTDAMLYSGKILSFNDPTIVDKHSTGGIGDKTSFVVSPLAAAAGVKVPSIAGRGLGFTGGTVDKIEAIPGFNTALTLEQYEKNLMERGIVLLGQTGDLAPADKVIYALRDVTSTVASIPLITASIMSKKLAEGIAGIVLDVKFGAGAFMKDKNDAKLLAESLANTAERFNKRSMVFLTDMSQPLGHMVGNTLEIIECIDILKGKGPADLIEICLELAGGMIYLAGKSSSHKEGIALAKKLLEEGAGLKKFTEMVVAQGGDPRVVDDYGLMPTATERYEVRATQDGFISEFANEDIGHLCTEIGGGRKIATDKIDHGVGFCFHKKVGDQVNTGDSLLTIYHNPGQESLIEKVAARFISDIIKISPKRPKALKLICERIIR